MGTGNNPLAVALLPQQLFLLSVFQPCAAYQVMDYAEPEDGYLLLHLFCHDTAPFK
jgi:hypothetical protein